MENVSTVFQRFFKGVECIMEVPKAFHGCFKEMSSVLQECVKDVCRKFQGVEKKNSQAF